MDKLAQLDRDDCYLYDLPQNVFESLNLMYFDSSTTQIQSQQLPAAESQFNSPDLKHIEEKKISNSNECSTCLIKFPGDSSIDSKRSHYKSDLHKFNLKRNIDGSPPVSEQEFDKLLEEQSIESLSGTDDSSSDEDLDEEFHDKMDNKLDVIFEKLSVQDKLHQDNNEENPISYLNTKSPFILFSSPFLPQDKAFGVYKSFFPEKDLLTDPKSTILSYSKKPINSKYLALFMIGGGHFAGAIISHVRKNIKGNANTKESKQEQAVEVMDSKTFHRYTVRRKQGGSQSASDNARGKANSAGSSIRRYNEQALIHEVRELLDSWKGYLQNCETIYIRANGASNRKILVGYDGSILKNEDPRIRSFPFTTKRATKSELKKAWVHLSYLSIVDIPKSNEKLSKKLQNEREGLNKSKRQGTPSKSSTPEAEEDSSPEAKHSIELINLLKKSRAPMLINYMKKNKLSPNFTFVPEFKYKHNPTPLHYAAAHGLHHMVQVLLINLKSDPTITNEFGRTACELSADYNTRKVFQTSRFSLGEDFCDWGSAKVGNPKSKEEFMKEEEQAKELEASEKKKLHEEELAKKTELELKQPSISSSGTLGGGPNKVLSQVSETSGLTDAQKMRLMREQRARAAEARIKKMQGN